MELTHLNKAVDKKLKKLAKGAEDKEPEQYRGHHIYEKLGRFDVCKGDQKLGDAANLEAAKEMVDKIHGGPEETSKKEITQPAV